MILTLIVLEAKISKVNVRFWLVLHQSFCIFSYFFHFLVFDNIGVSLAILISGNFGFNHIHYQHLQTLTLALSLQLLLEILDSFDISGPCAFADHDQVFFSDVEDILEMCNYCIFCF